jgi:magnesium and cobalt transporter
MEEIVGEIEDEHDLPTDNSFFWIKKNGEKNFQFGGRVEIEKVEEVFAIKIRQNYEEFQTINGLIMTMFKRVPEIGEEIEQYGLKFKIIDANSRLVKLVEISASHT